MDHLSCSWYMFFLSFPLAVCQIISGEGICMPPNSPFIKCCIGYFLKENKCLECAPGYTGENCSWTCPSGYYGRLCNERCACSPDEYCEPIRGCLCNSTSVNCTNAEQTVTTTMVNEGIVVKTQSSHSDQRTEYIMDIVLPLLISMIACLFIGSFCIRMRYVIMKKKRKELHPTNIATDLHTRNQCPQTEENGLSTVASSEVYNHLNLRVNYQNISHYYMDNMATGGIPPACHGFSSTDQKEIRINWNLLRNNENRYHDGLGKSSKVEGFGDIVHGHTENEQLDIYSTPNKGATKKPPHGFSKQRQQKKFCKIVKFNISESCQAAAVDQTDSQTNQNEESPKSKIYEDMNANNGSLAYDNNCFRPESPMDERDSDDYFDVSYDGQLAISSSKNNKLGHTTYCPSETDPDLSDYINADGLDSYR